MQQGNLGDGGGVCNLFEGDSDLARKRDGVYILENFFSFLFFLLKEIFEVKVCVWPRLNLRFKLVSVHSNHIHTIIIFFLNDTIINYVLHY